MLRQQLQMAEEQLRLIYILNSKRKIEIEIWNFIYLFLNQFLSHARNLEIYIYIYIYIYIKSICLMHEYSIYEPDVLKMTSIGELESCERQLVGTLTRVQQRKDHTI